MASAQTGEGRPVRPLTVVAFLVVVLITILAALGTHSLVRGEERRLLRERTAEVGLVFNTALTAIPSSLRALGQAWALSPDSAAAFTRTAAAQQAGSTSRSQVALAMTAPVPGGFRVLAEYGPGLSVGQVLTGPVDAVLARALRSPAMIATPVTGTGANRTLGFALGPPSAPPRMVLYQQSLLGPVAAPPQANSAPFAELNVAIYGSPRPVSSQLLVTTTKQLPLRGSVRYQPFQAGATPWLLAVSAKHPLVGTVAAEAPWYVLGAGLLGSVLVGLVVEVLLRRRDAALALYAAEHRVAETLQRSLLPVLPRLRDIDVAARYVPSGAGQDVGGDWFDVFDIQGGRVGVAIGDVLGHDIEAAAAMSQVRAALRAYAYTGDDPAVVVDHLDHLVDTFGMAPLVTVVYGVLDAPADDGSRLLRFSNAGHLSPMLRCPDGQVVPLDSGASVVIGGAPSPLAHSQAEERLPVGSTLLLFTDGLVEARGRSLDTALGQVADALAGAEPTADAASICDRVLAVTAADDLRDDVALLALRILG